MEQVAFKIEGIIAVQNHGTSGSTLMQSLLDSHPNILSLPALHGRELYVFWQKFGHLPAIEFLPHFVKAYRFWDSLGIDLFGFHEMGLNRDEYILSLFSLRMRKHKDV
jgi:hypothetical protein